MKRLTQRDVMRRIFRERRGHEEQVVRAYAAAEERGEAVREKNAQGMDAQTYARALFSDGRRKGWLRL
jgi:hypothetical protein